MSVQDKETTHKYVRKYVIEYVRYTEPVQYVFINVHKCCDKLVIFAWLAKSNGCLAHTVDKILPLLCECCVYVVKQWPQIPCSAGP